MGNEKLKWEEKWSAFFWIPRNYDFFGDGGMWASVAIGQLSMEGKSVLLVFFFFWHHGKNITGILLIFIQQN